MAETGVELKDNGFRHSYITYRVAQINDTARVALETGNSPDVIFAHYRDLVAPDEATAWFSVMPAARAATPLASAADRKFASRSRFAKLKPG